MIDAIAGVPPNAILAVPAIVMGSLLIYAFRRYVFAAGGGATRHFGMALLWLNLAITGRTIWWDIYGGFGFGIESNAIWHLIHLFASFHGLKGLLLLIPRPVRAEYNILTVAFYPHRLWRRLRGPDQEDSGDE